jgi:hypothetical protein
LLIHFYTNLSAGYGIFRDELYYVACSEHLSAGYVDQPPLSIFILALNRLLLGDSIFALRLLPAVAGAATVFTTGIIARELGGGRFAQASAACASIASLVFLGMNTVFSMNCFDILLQTLAVFLVIRLVKTGDAKYWPLLGLALGLGLLNKVGVLWLGFGILVGFVLTEQRAWLKTKWPYLAGALALLFFIPFLAWNLAHNLAHVEFIRNATSGIYRNLNVVSFALGQIVIQNPVIFPLWLSGLLFLFFGLEKKYRILGIAFVSAFLVLALNGHSKSEYLSPLFPMLFASGSLAFERWFSGRWRWVRRLHIGLMLVGGVLLAPLVLPVLPVETYIHYSAALGVAPSSSEAKQLGKLPQFYADMFGWEEKAEAVARVFHSLPPGEQASCALFADNYGRCGAIDFYGWKYSLPKSIGKHNNYWIWGPREYTGELMIILGGDLQDKQRVFGSVEVAGVVSSPYCMPYENDLKIYVCRKLKVPLADFWPRLKSFG